MGISTKVDAFKYDDEQTRWMWTVKFRTE